MTDAARRHQLVARFRRARSDPGLAVLEGFHPLKHALRFGAELLEIVCADTAALDGLARELAPDLVDELSRRRPATARELEGEPPGAGERAWERGFVFEVDDGVLEELVPVVPHTGVVALARRRAPSAADVLGPARHAAGDDLASDDPASGDPASDGPGPVVVLDRPVHLGNLGACVRAAAAAGATGLLSLGPHDPWHPDAIRGAAGLQFALPVARADGLSDLPAHDRPLVALDPGGELLAPGRLPGGALLAFGGERSGLAPEILQAAALRVSIPMAPGVSSLNLATAVAVTLYACRWG